jgi:hypothetical protein
MEFEKSSRWENPLWDYDVPALIDAQPCGLMRHVATRRKNDEMKLVEFVVECANGTVNACITLKIDLVKHIPAILVEIVAAHV